LLWASPITLDDSKLKGATVTKLLQSSANSWTTTTTTTDADPKTYASSGGFALGTDMGRHTLAVMVQGSLTSYFQGKTLPFATTPTPVVGAQTPTAVPLAGQSAGFIAKSPDTTRLVVVGSTEFLDDTIFRIEQQAGVDRSGESVQLVQNSVDSFTQDAALATIRAKGNETHLLAAISDDAQKLWEVGNYLFALILIIALGIVWQVRRRSQKPMRLIMPKEYEPQKGEA
jgi:ABC-2 type transport system permease protein